eukprot:366267-Chlamydomonas_euryale.AAC.2
MTTAATRQLLFLHAVTSPPQPTTAAANATPLQMQPTTAHHSPPQPTTAHHSPPQLPQPLQTPPHFKCSPVANASVCHQPHLQTKVPPTHLPPTPLTNNPPTNTPTSPPTHPPPHNPTYHPPYLCAPLLSPRSPMLPGRACGAGRPGRGGVHQDAAAVAGHVQRRGNGGRGGAGAWRNVGWLDGWLIGWLVGWLVDWLLYEDGSLWGPLSVAVTHLELFYQCSICQEASWIMALMPWNVLTTCVEGGSAAAGLTFGAPRL